LETLKLPLRTSGCACGTPDHHKPSPGDDAALVSAMLDGDERAWRELITRYGPSVRRCITAVTSRFRGVVSSDDEEEIFSTFCLRLLQNDRSKLAAFDAGRGASLGTWLGMVAIQTAYDLLRQRRREKNRDHRAPLEALVAGGPDPFDLYLHRERQDLARQLLDRITERDRTFLTELCSETFEPEELARQMGIRLSTVYTKKHKLIGRLARLAAA
jgi:RNA polymerase sigma-70 factor (ECF subfamily)